ncbi:phospholipase D-like domain-containing protein [Niveibacterium sp. SC-1]|uniref:phospholipase D-like domain-containing protein n=1 Tax=Niveibacterium sp. SC-1 TaxID=3135646 RepID=UPI00311F6B0D
MAAAILAGACSSVPVSTANAAPAENAASPQGVRVQKASGDISLQGASGLANKLASEESARILKRHLGEMEKMGGPPLIAGNQVRLLKDGPAFHKALMVAAREARDHINIESYIFEDKGPGQELAALLKEKQRAGVQVNVLYDEIGSLSTPDTFFEDLRKAGIAVRKFAALPNPNERDHRKIIVVDGKVAFTGGMNISSVYSSGSSPKRRSAPATDQDAALKDGWRDTQVEIRGPAVGAFQKLFLETWQLQGDRSLVARDYLPATPVQGDKVLRVIASSPRDAGNPIYVELLTAIRRAQRSVHITNAYFVPSEEVLQALKAAAARGVEVGLQLPGFGDSSLVFHAGRSTYTELLESGVKLYEFKDAFLHAKTAVIDGVWSFVGSANMDMRSFLHNDEVLAVVIGEEFGQQMEAMFAQDMARTREVTLAQWRERGLVERSKEAFSQLWWYWL